VRGRRVTHSHSLVRDSLSARRAAGVARARLDARTHKCTHTRASARARTVVGDTLTEPGGRAVAGGAGAAAAHVRVSGDGCGDGGGGGGGDGDCWAGGGWAGGWAGGSVLWHVPVSCSDAARRRPVLLSAFSFRPLPPNSTGPLSPALFLSRARASPRPLRLALSASPSPPRPLRPRAPPLPPPPRTPPSHRPAPPARACAGGRAGGARAAAARGSAGERPPCPSSQHPLTRLCRASATRKARRRACASARRSWRCRCAWGRLGVWGRSGVPVSDANRCPPARRPARPGTHANNR
jgi:hypothetical protein